MISRRQFLGHATCAGFSLSGLLSTVGTLRLLNATLSAQTLPANGDFKALVCLFLYGGNDGNNMLIPYDTSGYAAYAAARDILAIPRTDLQRLTPRAGDGREFSLHPSLGRLAGLFNTGKMAALANVGTLVSPLSKAQYLKGGAAVPPYLFSHSDQQVQWQTSVPDSPLKVGWGGRLADLLQTLNSGSQISMNISLSGTNYFQIGNEVFQFQMNQNGSVGLTDSSATWAPALQQYAAARNLVGHSYGEKFEQEYVNVAGRAINNETLIRSVLSTIPDYSNYFAASAGANGQLNDIAGQLRMILRMISAQNALGMRRQVYFAAIGGFDTHDNQIASQSGLLKTLDNAIADFHGGTVALGLSEKVTLFSASDFSRTYNGNGKGSDHAWGNHHFIVGGAVNGGNIYGTMPTLQVDGPDDAGNRGAWIPTTSTDEYSATLARWFGVAPAQMGLVLPNIGRFARPDLGFMR